MRESIKNRGAFYEEKYKKDYKYWIMCNSFMCISCKFSYILRSYYLEEFSIMSKDFFSSEENFGKVLLA